MAFPTSPTNGQTYTVNGIIYVYNSTKTAWQIQSSGSATVPTTVGTNLSITGNFAASGTMSITGNANVGNIGTATAIITTGNITTVNSGLMQNGNSNVAITANGAVAIAANGLTRLNIDTSGRNTLPYQPGFYARGPDSNQTLSNGADLQFNNAIYNVGSHFNTSNYRFTAPVAGRYLFTWSVFVNTVAGRCSLKVNNAGYNNLQMDAGAGFSQAAILNLNANDYVTVGDWQNISGMVCYMGHAHFSGMLLG